MNNNLPHLLQITGKIHTNKKNKDLGSTKDMRARASFLKKNGCRVSTIGIESRSDSICLNTLKDMRLQSFTHILFEHNRYPKSQIWLRNNYPEIKIIVRTHNAEFPHSIDKIKAIIKQPFDKGIKRKLKEIIKNFLRTIKILYLDVKTANHCDNIISCSSYETKNYWSVISRKNNCVTVGTFSELDALYSSDEEKTNDAVLKVCMVGGSVANHFNDLSLANYFKHLISMTAKTQNSFVFLYSGKYNIFPDITIPLCKPVRQNISIHALMNSYDVLVVCTDLGRGIKTKILDAMACGKYVLIPNKLMKRLDPLLMDKCISYDGSDEGFERALISLRKSPPHKPSSIKRSHELYRDKYQKNFLNLIFE